MSTVPCVAVAPKDARLMPYPWRMAKTIYPVMDFCRTLVLGTSHVMAAVNVK